MAQKVNLVIDQGATFESSFTLTDEDGVGLDLGSHVGNSHMRQYYTSTTFYAFTVTTSNTGIVTLSMTANATNVIPAGRYTYDVELTAPNGNVSRVVEGVASVMPGVTK
jgi:hypothetical protein